MVKGNWKYIRTDLVDYTTTVEKLDFHYKGSREVTRTTVRWSYVRLEDRSQPYRFATRVLNLSIPVTPTRPNADLIRIDFHTELPPTPADRQQA